MKPLSNITYGGKHCSRKCAESPEYDNITDLFKALQEGKHERGQVQFLIDQGMVTVVGFHGYDRHGDPLDPDLLLDSTPERLLRDLCRHLGFYAEEV